MQARMLKHRKREIKPLALHEYQLSDEDSEILNEISHLNIKYRPEDRIYAATCWVVLGSREKASQHCGVPADTIGYWMRTTWWKNLVKLVRRAYQDELDAKLTGVIHDGVDALQDRVENGNFRVNPATGELHRVPLSSTELARDAVGILFDKRALIRGDPTSRTEKISSEEILKQLAAQFLKLVKENEPKAIECEVIEDGKTAN